MKSGVTIAAPPDPADTMRILATLHKNIQNRRARKCGCHLHATTTLGANRGLRRDPPLLVLALVWFLETIGAPARWPKCNSLSQFDTCHLNAPLGIRLSRQWGLAGGGTGSRPIATTGSEPYRQRPQLQIHQLYLRNSSGSRAVADLDEKCST